MNPDNTIPVPEKRRSGNTTRLADQAIQTLFSTGICECIDNGPGFELADKQKMNLALMNRVADWLRLEHPQIKFLAHPKYYSITLLK